MSASNLKKKTFMLAEALRLNRSGWSILPLHSCFDSLCTCTNPNCSSQGKHPRTKNGVKDATSDPNTICAWWSQWPTANIGISTGHSNLVVVDVDPRHGGEESWKKLTSAHQMPKTLTVTTGGDGLHAYFHAPSTQIPSRTNVLPGIDIRGVGGYVVAPPSLHKSGKIYEWDKTSPSTLAQLPECFISLILNPTPPKRQRTKSVIQEGSRNQTFASVAGLLRKHGFEQFGIQSALESLNSKICTPPLPMGEIESISKSISKYPNKGQWPDPLELPTIKNYTPSFTPEHIPANLRPWVCDIADRMQVPLDFIAIPAICSLSSVIGRQVGLFPKQADNWLVIPNLWGAVIARPGYFKSPAIAEALRPLENLVREERQKFEAQSFVSKAKQDMIKTQMEATKEKIKTSVKKGEKDEIEPLQKQLESHLKEIETLHVKEKRFKTNDATIEKIGALLLENPDGLLIFRDELSGWLKSLQKLGREGEREFYLEAWNGYGSYTIDRIGRGTLHIPSLCLSIFGGLQPGKLESYIHKANMGGEGDDGLLQRFQLLVYPTIHSKWKNIDRSPNKEALQQAQSVFTRLANINPQDIGAIQDPDYEVPGLRFEQNAQERFNQWRENLENRLRQGENQSASFESHLAKYRSMVPSLALIFHLTEKHIGRIQISSLELAIKWSEILELHARKVYSSLLDDELSSAQNLVEKIKKGLVSDGMTARAIYRKCWSGLEAATQVDNALGVLEDSHWLRIENVKGVGRPREEIRLNPKLPTLLNKRK